MGSEYSILGLDGCRAGWTAVYELKGALSVELWPDLKPLFERPWDMAMVDIPIGLASRGIRRECDSSARALLKDKRSSVFFAPGREDLEATRYEDVRTQGMSLQTFYLLPKIREVDRTIRTVHQKWLREAHPELAFWARGGPLLDKKRTKLGREQRQNVLRDLGSKFHLTDWSSHFRRKEVALDDLLDAAILLEVARDFVDGKGRVLGGKEQDSRGLKMEICFL